MPALEEGLAQADVAALSERDAGEAQAAVAGLDAPVCQPPRHEGAGRNLRLLWVGSHTGAGFIPWCTFVLWQAGSYNLLLKLIGSSEGKTIVRKPYYGFSLSPLFIFKCY